MRKVKKQEYIIGLDEVGRGSLAGPVTVCAAVIPKNLGFRIQDLGKLRDSKQLTAKQREIWFTYFKDHPKISFAVAHVWPATIDRINISRAANRAALRAFLNLGRRYTLHDSRYTIYLDGGLYLGNVKSKRENLKSIAKVKTIIKADEKINAVKIASIIAKVQRDRLMTRLAKKYPKYGFEIHKGYGTKRHKEAIRTYGSSEMHRLTFLN